jgi:hypothetical protein
MSPALACIILHMEISLYQLFNRKNVGMQAKKHFIFFILKLLLRALTNATLLSV